MRKMSHKIVYMYRKRQSSAKACHAKLGVYSRFTPAMIVRPPGLTLYGKDLTYGAACL